MNTTSKPSSGAFILRPDKAEEFLNKKTASSKKSLERFFAHQPKKGVITPYKGGNE